MPNSAKLAMERKAQSIAGCTLAKPGRRATSAPQKPTPLATPPRQPNHSTSRAPARNATGSGARTAPECVRTGWAIGMLVIVPRYLLVASRHADSAQARHIRPMARKGLEVAWAGAGGGFCIDLAG